jgi:hypothetical protein
MKKNHWGRSALMPLLMLTASLWGCATAPKPSAYRVQTQRLASADGFDVLLLKSVVGMEDTPAEETISRAQAKDLLQLLRFKIADGNVAAYGPRVLASFLLEEALTQGQPITHTALTQRLNQSTHLIVLNPEGHLVLAYSGALMQCVGPLHVQDGVLGAGGFKVDTFYVVEGDSFREAEHAVAPVFFQQPAPPKPGQQIASAPAP